MKYILLPAGMIGVICGGIRIHLFTGEWKVLDVLSFSLVYSGQALTVRGETGGFDIFDFKLRL